ncbi:hypothetical protein IWQ56_000253 [Coemansia nantahalensis]|nr:hypothetical protein IWQ56_000253 [Coemansia nantahalensis]
MKVTIVLALLCAGAHAATELTATPFIGATESKFGPTIEGAAVDKAGNIYAVDFDNNIATAGSVTGPQKQLFKAPDAEALINGIRFAVDKSGAEEAYVVDAKLHQVYRLSGQRGADGAFANSGVFCKDSTMLQPNDIAIALSTGRIFLSGMNYTADSVIGNGDLWTCGADGVAKRLGQFYRTNGIEVSPDEKTLYLSEAENKKGAVTMNRVLAFDLDAATGETKNKRVFVDFGELDKSAATDIDGMRTDVSGNLYVTRNGIGKVSVFDPSGKLTATISTPSIDSITNLEFGGPAGTDLYMVGKCKDTPAKGCVDVLKGQAVGNALKRLGGGGGATKCGQ